MNIEGERMNKKSILGLILFAGLITICLFFSAYYLTSQGSKTNADAEQSYTEENTEDENTGVDTSDKASSASSEADNDNFTDADDAGTQIPGETDPTTAGSAVDIATQEPWLTSNPSDTGNLIAEGVTEPEVAAVLEEQDSSNTSTDVIEALQLISDCDEVDYQSYIPEMIYDSYLEAALDITNPSITIDAEAAILFDADTKEVLYHKNPVQAVFPASTIKLLTSIVVLENCKEDEEVTIGDEITMIATDSSMALIKEGQILTIRNLLEGMLLPSGNDAAYAVATYVGRKSLQNPEATAHEAVVEFVKLMNEQAKKIGVKNSCFKTPDGYDAIGQYTTAYDMGLIGIEAAKYDTIIEITQKSKSSNTFASGEEVTWPSSNKLINRYSGQYYSSAIGLKTGTTTMAGRCLVAAAEKDGRRVVCAIMDSSSSGRWEDAIALLQYGLE
jgi:D-alanyl-D-alanine carboxypeptidase (penicillin-binding protein 5/6)